MTLTITSARIISGKLSLSVSGSYNFNGKKLQLFAAPGAITLPISNSQVAELTLHNNIPTGMFYTTIILPLPSGWCDSYVPSPASAQQVFAANASCMFAVFNVANLSGTTINVLTSRRRMNVFRGILGIR